MVQDPHLRATLVSLDQLSPRAEAALAGLPAAAFVACPPGGGWSIAQVFEHLCVADAGYVDQALPRALDRARARRPRPWRPSWLGGWLRTALANPNQRLPAPKAWQVGPQVRPDVVPAWRAGVQRLRALVEGADGADLRTGLSSPVAWFVRLNLGDALAIPVVHGHRHMAQVERTRRALGC